MADNKWQRKARALARLAEDQRGKPEGDLAWDKLQELLDAHPEASLFGPIIDLIQHEMEWLMTGSHFVQMKKSGVDIDGYWEGETLESAIGVMVADYRKRYTEHLGKLLPDERPGNTREL